MRTKSIVLILAVVLLIGAAAVRFSKVHLSRGAAVQVECLGETIYELSDEDAAQIRDMFDGSRLYFDFPACGFDGDCVTIRVGGATFLPALDDCGTVQYGARYFSLSDRENAVMRRILAEYGVRTPCFY